MKALLIIDLQYDFLPGGSLAVPEGDQVISPINTIVDLFDCVVLTQDWHPSDHSSFASNNPGKKPYDVITMNYGEQVLWPDHCVQGTKGAEIHHELKTSKAQIIIRKGFRSKVDSYSAFYENDHKTATGLDGYLKVRKANELFLCGLAADFCVKWSALDAVQKGYKVHVISDAVKGIDIDSSVAEAIAEMKDAGVHFLDSQEVKNSFD